MKTNSRLPRSLKRTATRSKPWRRELSHLTRSACCCQPTTSCTRGSTMMMTPPARWAQDPAGHAATPTHPPPRASLPRTQRGPHSRSPRLDHSAAYCHARPMASPRSSSSTVASPGESCGARVGTVKEHPVTAESAVCELCVVRACACADVIAGAPGFEICFMQYGASDP